MMIQSISRDVAKPRLKPETIVLWMQTSQGKSKSSKHRFALGCYWINSSALADDVLLSVNCLLRLCKCAISNHRSLLLPFPQSRKQWHTSLQLDDLAAA